MNDDFIEETNHDTKIIENECDSNNIQTIDYPIPLFNNISSIPIQNKAAISDFTDLDILFKGKIVSVSAYNDMNTIQKLMTQKSSECGIWTRKISVYLEISSKYIRETNLDGNRILCVILVQGMKFALIPSKSTQRYRFQIKGYNSKGKMELQRIYEVKSSTELNIWYDQLTRAKTESQKHSNGFQFLCNLDQDYFRKSIAASELSNKAEIDQFDNVTNKRHSLSDMEIVQHSDSKNSIRYSLREDNLIANQEQVNELKEEHTEAQKVNYQEIQRFLKSTKSLLMSYKEIIDKSVENLSQFDTELNNLKMRT
ncbi:hypothetical protein BC833DRAFT_596063 [Globomyces pollinis-pini]|nr:hypothetical protein BC833DRAFT_596063 [Globomyces pollinis-pini]